MRRASTGTIVTAVQPASASEPSPASAAIHTDPVSAAAPEYTAITNAMANAIIATVKLRHATRSARIFAGRIWDEAMGIRQFDCESLNLKNAPRAAREGGGIFLQWHPHRFHHLAQQGFRLLGLFLRGNRSRIDDHAVREHGTRPVA